MILMALHPEEQARAQREIDSVIGHSRLPTLADKPDLPYTDALIKEVMRWHPMLPLGMCMVQLSLQLGLMVCLGFPRSVATDDTYDGYHIAKGTIILPNAWYVTCVSSASILSERPRRQISHEPNAKYPPEAFLPERFLDPDVPTTDPCTYIFGFGRRWVPSFLFYFLCFSGFPLRAPLGSIPVDGGSAEGRGSRRHTSYMTALSAMVLSRYASLFNVAVTWLIGLTVCNLTPSHRLTRMAHILTFRPRQSFRTP